MNNTNKKDGQENLVQNITPFSFGVGPEKKRRTKKRIRRIADPHIEPFKTAGREYYRYRRGTDAPVYLGTADSILRAVWEHQAKGKH